MKLGKHGWGNWMTGLSSFELGWDAIHLVASDCPFRERHIRASVYIRVEINFGMFSISVIRSVGRKKASQCRVESDDWFIHQQSNGVAELLLLDKWELQVGFPPRVFLSLSLFSCDFIPDGYVLCRASLLSRVFASVPLQPGGYCRNTHTQDDRFTRNKRRKIT